MATSPETTKGQSDGLRDRLRRMRLARNGRAERPALGEDERPPGDPSDLRPSGIFSFTELATAYFAERAQGRLSREWLKELVEFQQENGRFHEFYWGKNLDVAAALTVDKEHSRKTKVHHEYGAEVLADDRVSALLYQICILADHAELTLTTRDRRICMEMIYHVLSTLFRELDKEKAAADRSGASSAAGADNAVDGKRRGKAQKPPAWLTHLADEYRRARDYFERSAQRQAQMYYFTGMILGLALVSAVAIGLRWGIEQTAHLEGSSEFWIPCFVAGSVGAMISVMSAITAGKLRLNDIVLGSESGRAVLTIAGVMRPVVGAVFGLVLFVFVEAGLFPLDVPGADRDAMFFYIALAFLAGFSERWARGVVAGTEKRLVATDEGPKERTLPPLATARQDEEGR